MLSKELFSNIESQISAKFQSELNQNDKAFLKRVYSTAPEVYTTRLQAIGFLGLEHVLDAGCGFGQWSLCLAQGGSRVHAVDISTERVNATKMAFDAAFGHDHIQIASVGSILDLNIPQCTFDAVFCYRTIMSIDWKKALAELVRVLKPGGILYSFANDIGYIVNMWMNRPNRTSDFDPRELAANSFLKTLEYENNGDTSRFGQIIIACEDKVNELIKLGCEILETGPEGTVNLHPEKAAPRPFFQPSYFGLPGNYEVLARKGVV